MLITKKDLKILKSNKVNELQKRKVARKKEKRINTIKNIIIISLFILVFGIIGNMEYEQECLDREYYLNTYGYDYTQD